MAEQQHAEQQLHEQQHQERRPILIPVADDDQSEATFGWALENIVQPTDEVHILHVIVATARTGLKLDYFDQSDEKGVLAAQQQMIERRFHRQLRERGLQCPVTVHLVQASEDPTTVGRIVCRHAEQIEAALVVMARPDHGRLHDALFGNACVYVEKHCSRPVRAVKPSEVS